MNYKILTSQKFDKEIKRLSRKFSTLKTEFASLIQELQNNPFIGTSIKPHCFKIRISIASKGKGKSGGARVITYVYVKAETVFLLTIYNKSEIDNISEKQLKDQIDEIKL